MPNLDIAAAPAPVTIGPYRVLREIGRGGMGFVYEAVHEQLQRRVAIKLLRRDLASEPEQVARFVREGRAACNVRHPHVIEVYEFGQCQGAPYLVMDLVVGETLGESLRRSGTIPLPELLSIALPILSAVIAAHEAGVVHRDLKPGNIMLTTDRVGNVVPKVLDFGTSKLFGDNADLALTQSAAVIGTPYYMSPEQARASRHVDERCDQYSLGVIFYECATGARPFEGDSIYDLMHAIMTAEVTPASEIVPSLPRAFDRIIRRAMSRDPDDRYPSVAAFASALLELAGPATRRTWAEEFKQRLSSGRRPSEPEVRRGDIPTRSGTNPVLAGDSDALARQRSRRRWTVATLAALILLAAVIAWGLSSRGGSPAAFIPQPPAASAAAAPVERPTPLPQPVATTPAAPPGAAEPPATSRAAPDERERSRASAPAARNPTKSQGAKSEPSERRARSRHGPASSPVGWGDNGAPIIE